VQKSMVCRHQHAFFFTGCNLGRALKTMRASKEARFGKARLNNAFFGRRTIDTSTQSRFKLFFFISFFLSWDDAALVLFTFFVGDVDAAETVFSDAAEIALLPGSPSTVHLDAEFFMACTLVISFARRKNSS